MKYQIRLFDIAAGVLIFALLALLGLLSFLTITSTPHHPDPFMLTLEYMLFLLCMALVSFACIALAILAYNIRKDD